MKAWNSLYHKETVHDYMTEVNDLVLAHPLGEKATFWHAWHGLRPEFKSEIDHMLDQQGRQTCSLKELKQMLLSIELKYPYRQPKPFPPRYNVRQVNTFQSTQPQQQQQSRSTFACWICASPDHRMEGCPKKKKSGCPICGSRAPEFECRAIEIHSPPALQMSQIKVAAQNDPEYSQIDVSKIHGEWEHRDDIWYSVDEVPTRCIIPNDDIIRDRIISELYETPLAGHLGVKKTYERVKTYFYWHGMKASIEEFVRTCDTCQRASTKPSENINVHTIIARHPWEVVTIDFLCGFAPATHTKHTSCIVITDKHTRQIHLRSCTLNPTAAETAQMFMEMVVCKHGLPKLIISDRGTQFDSTLWLKLFETLGSRCALASTHHPQTNGATERVNRTLIQMIRKYASTQQTKWAQFLPYFEFAYNSAVHSTTGIAPFVAELGRMPNIPIAMLMPIDRPDAPTDIRTKIYEIATQMQSIRNNILVADEKAADTKPYVHLPDHSDSFIPGDEVLLYAPYLPLQAEHRKHIVTWKGPFIILREITAGAYELTGIEKTLPTVYHQSKLRKYNRTTRPDERINMPPQPLEFIDGYVIFEVDAILDHRTLRGKRQYQLRWKGTSETSWEDEVNLTGCVALLRQYLISIGEGGRVLPPELTSERAAPLSPPDNTSLMTQPPAPQSQPIPSTTPPMRRSRRLSMTQV